MQAKQIQIIRRPGVLAITGLSKSTLHEKVRRGEFPPPVALGERARGWKLEDVERWIAERPIAGSTRKLEA